MRYNLDVLKLEALGNGFGLSIEIDSIQHTPVLGIHTGAASDCSHGASFREAAKDFSSQARFVRPCRGGDGGQAGAFRNPAGLDACPVRGGGSSAVPLAKRLKKCMGSRGLYFSASTKTGYDIACEKMKNDADAVFFFPYDLLPSVRRRVKQIDPAMVIIVETDIWPNFLNEMKRKKIPVLLANARLSRKSFAGYRRFWWILGASFLTFRMICAQTRKDLCRFRALGIPEEKITLTGNVKFDQEEIPATAGDLEALQQSLDIGDARKVLLAGSTHDGEEKVLMDVFTRLKKISPDLLLMVAPRDPGRAENVFRLFDSNGFLTVLMNRMKEPNPDKAFDVIVVDVMGVLRRLYALADLAFIGGSLVRAGGHNPLEPAYFAKPILFGPDMSDFSEIAQLLVEADAAVRVVDSDSAFEAAAAILTETDRARRMGENAFHVFTSNKGAVEKTVKVVKQILKTH